MEVLQGGRRDGGEGKALNWNAVRTRMIRSR